MSKDLIPFIYPLTEEETERFVLNLWYLLAKQTERYTMGDSTSVSVEIAQELLSSICFTLQFEMEVSKLSNRDLLGMELYTILKDGQTHLKEKTEEVKSSWEQIYVLAEQSENPEVMELLSLIELFFKRYDYYFFAHQTPWDMGIPLIGSDARGLKGISYVEKYLAEMKKLVLGRK